MDATSISTSREIIQINVAHSHEGIFFSMKNIEKYYFQRAFKDLAIA